MIPINSTFNTSVPVNCSDPSKTHVPVFTAIPSYSTTVFGVYFLPIIIIFGVTGNSITIVILRKAASKITSHFYLWWLAIFDIISLISYLPAFWAVMIVRVYYQYLYGPNNPASWIEYYLLGNGVCQIRMFATFFARTCSTYAIVLVTVERFIFVVFPMKGTNWCTMKSAKIAVTVMVLCSAAVNFPWFFAFNVIRKPCFKLGICTPNHILIINRLIEFIIMCLIPCLVIFICNICIIVTLRKRQQLNILINKKDAKKQEKIITIRLLSVSFVFFFLVMPSLVVVCIHTYNEFNHIKTHMSGPGADALILSIILFSINLAVNFIIYCLTGRHFRQAAKYLLFCNLAAMRRQRNYLVNETSGGASNNTEKMELYTSGDRVTQRPSMDSNKQQLLKH